MKTRTRKHEKPSRLMALALAGVALAGCQSVGQELGVGKLPPDEFAVVRNRPLELPADTQALPPPQPGAPARVAVNPAREAKEALFGQAPATAAGASSGETALLDAVGAANAGPEARAQIARGDVGMAASDDDWFSWENLLIPFPNSASDSATVVVDGEAELRRIEAAKEAGKPIADGVTPVVRPGGSRDTLR